MSTKSLNSLNLHPHVQPEGPVVTSASINTLRQEICCSTDKQALFTVSVFLLAGKGRLSEAPIPTRPTLARGSASRRKVPPIPVSPVQQQPGAGDDDDFTDDPQDEVRAITLCSYLGNLVTPTLAALCVPRFQRPLEDKSFWLH